MNQLNSNDYYRDRESRERQLAEAARDPYIAAIHRDLATRYAVLATESAIAEIPPSRAR